jgi:hypothetical protein
MGGRPAPGKRRTVRSRTIVGVAAAAGAALAVATAALLPLGETKTPAPPSRPIAVQASFTPGAVEFGDAVTARIVVTLDAHAVRPSSLHLAYGVAPLTQLGRTVERHATRGGLSVVTYELRAACLSDACVVESGRRTIVPHAVRADVARKDGGRANVTIAWSELAVAGRVTRSDLSVSRPPFRAAATPTPPTYRLQPGTLAALLDAAAAILAAGAAALVASALLRARHRRPDEHPDELAHALQLARAARTRPERDRRAAVGYVARMLARRDASLARTAGELAWSRPSPSPDSLTELVDGVEQETQA